MTTTTTDDEVPYYDDGENEEESAEYDGENECCGIVCTRRVGGVYGCLVCSLKGTYGTDEAGVVIAPELDATGLLPSVLIK